jgi:hypothetical protein
MCGQAPKKEQDLVFGLSGPEYSAQYAVDIHFRGDYIILDQAYVCTSPPLTAEPDSVQGHKLQGLF